MGGDPSLRHLLDHVGGEFGLASAGALGQDLRYFLVHLIVWHVVLGVCIWVVNFDWVDHLVVAQVLLLVVQVLLEALVDL